MEHEDKFEFAGMWILILGEKQAKNRNRHGCPYKKINFSLCVVVEIDEIN